MEEFVEVAKKHPVAIGIGAVVLILVVMRGSSGGSAPSVNAQLEANKIASATDIALTNSDNALSAARALYASNQFLGATAANASIQVAADKNQTAILLAQMNHEDNQTQLRNGMSVSMADIAARQALGAQSLQATVQANQDSSNAKLTALVDTLQLQKYQTDVTAANLPALLHSQETQKQIAADNAQSIASINAQSAQAIAATNTSAQRTTAQASADKSSSDSWLSGIASIAGLFF